MLPALALGLEAVDELRAQDVDLPVKDAAAVRNFPLLVGESLDRLLQFGVVHGADIWKFVIEGHRRRVYASGANVKLSLSVRDETVQDDVRAVASISLACSARKRREARV